MEQIQLANNGFLFLSGYIAKIITGIESIHGLGESVYICGPTLNLQKPKVSKIDSLLKHGRQQITQNIIDLLLLADSTANATTHCLYTVPLAVGILP